MSTTIDEKVVEMRFDNGQFENSVRTSMSTLDKLKQKLHLTSASKGFEDLNSAANKVNFSGLSSAVETVQAKFSALDVMATTALVNITNSAINTGKQLVKSLSVDQISEGWTKYGEKTASVQTIMNSTGLSIQEVNDILEQLMWFSDETSYGFNDMTAALAQMTSSGGDIKKLVPLITGVANATAFAGKGAAEFSRVMYNLNQSYGAGYLNLMDWKSVELAGVGSKQLKETIISIAEELGKIGKGDVSVANFSESLKDKWADTEVMEKAFGKFAQVSQEAYRLVDEGKFDTASEAIESLSGKYDELAEKAFKSAQEAKSFTEAIDATKDAVSSGWMRTFEIIFGDYEKAKVLWTDLANTLWDIFASGGEVRNQILESALGRTFTSIVDNVKKITKPIQDTSDSIKAVVKSVQDYDKVVNEIIRGDWGRGQTRWDALTEAGYDWAHAQNLVNEQLGCSVRHVTNYTEAQEKANDAETALTETEKSRLKAALNLQYSLKKNLGYTDEQIAAFLKARGYTDEQIAAYKALRDTIDMLGLSVDDFVDNMDELDGRWLLINSAKNAGKGLLTVLKAIGTAWRQAFYGDASDEEILAKRSDRLFNLITTIHKLSTKLLVSDETASKITRTFKGLFAALDLVTTLLGGGFKIAFKVISQILGYFNIDILDVTAAIGDLLVSFRDWVDSTLDITKVLDKVVPLIDSAIKTLKKWFEEFQKLPWVEKVVANISELFSAISKIDLTDPKSFSALFELILSYFQKLKSLNFVEIGEFIFDGLLTGLANGASKVIETIVQVAKDLIAKFCEITGIHSPSTVFMAIGGFIIAGLLLGIKQGLISIPEALQDIVDKCISVIQNIDWGKIVALGASVAMIIFVKKVGDALDAIGSVFSGFGAILSNVAGVVSQFGKLLDGVAFDFKAKAIQKLAISLAILVGSLLLLVKIGGDDYLKLWNAVGVILALAIILGMLAFAVDRMSDASVDIGHGEAKIQGLKTGLIAIGASLLMMAAVVKIIGSMNMAEAIQGFAGLIVICGLLVGVFAAMGKLIKGKTAQNIDKIGGMLFKLSISLLLLAWVCKLIGKLSAEEMLQAGTFVTAFAIFVLALTAISKLGGKSINNLGGMMIKMAIAMALMVGVVKLIGLLSPEEMIKGYAFALGFAKFVMMLAVVTKIAAKEVPKLGGLLMSVAISMALMVGVVKLVGLLSPEEMIKGAAFALAFLGFLALLVKVTTIASVQKTAQVTGTILAVSIAIAAMAATSILLGLIDIKSLAKGVTAVSILGLVMAVMIRSLKGAKDVKGSLIAMTIAIAVMAGAVAGLSLIDPARLAGATVAMSTLVGMFALLVRSSKNVKKSFGSLIVMTAAIAVLGGMLLLLSRLDAKSNIQNAVALSVLMLSMAGVLTILSKIRKNTKRAIETLVSFGVLSVMLLVLAASLKMLNGVENSIENAIALGVLMLAMSGVLFILSNIGTKANKALPAVISLAALAVPMLLFAMVLKEMNGLENAVTNAIVIGTLILAMSGVVAILSLLGARAVTALVGVLALSALAIPMKLFVSVLSSMEGLKNAKKNAIVIGALMLAMTGVVAILSLFGVRAVSALAGILALTALVIPMKLFVGVLSSMEGLQNAKENAIIIGTLMVAMSALLGVLSLIGFLVVPALLGVASLCALVIPMQLFIGVLGKMNDIQNASANAGFLISMMVVMVNLLTALAAIGPLALIGVAALAGLEALMVSMGALVVVIGALVDKFPQLETFIDIGVPIMEKLASGLGSIIGNFVSGMLTTVSSCLPQVGQDLSDFMTKASVFIEGAKSIDESVVSGVGCLAKAILAITAAELLSALASYIGGGISLPQLGQDLTDFMKNALPFIVGVRLVDQSVVDSTKNLVALILLLAGVELIEGILSLVGINTDMDSLDEMLTSFAETMVKFSQAITEGGGIDTEAINAVTKAGSLMLELQKALPKTGGWLQTILGEEDLGVFGNKCAAFGKAMKKFSDSVSGENAIDSKAIESAAKAGTLMSELQNTLPKTGGWLQAILGEQDIEIFGNKCVAFGKAMKKFSDAVSGENAINSAAIEEASKAGSLMSELQNTLPKTGGWLQNILGVEDIQIFGNKCAAFGEAMSKFPEVNISEETIASIKSAGTAIIELQSILPKTGGLIQNITGEQDIQTFSLACESFATAMSKLSFMQPIGETTISSITSAGTAIAELQKVIPKTDGLIQNIAGTSDLEAFGNGCVSFSTAMAKLSTMTVISEDVIASIKSAGDMIIELQKAIPTSTWLDGKVELGEYSTQIGQFSDAMTKFSTIPMISEDVIASIKSAGDMIIELQKAIPTSEWLDGKLELGQYSTQIGQFSDAMTKFSTIPMISEDVIVSIKSAGDMIIELQKAIPTSEWLDGKLELGQYSTQIGQFSDAMAKFAGITQITEETITSVSNAGTAIIELQKSIPESKWLDGKVEIDEFGAKIQSFGDQLANYSNSIGSVQFENVNTSINLANRLVYLAKSLVDLDTSGIDNFDIESIGSAIGDYYSAIEDVDTGTVASSIASANRLVTLINSFKSIDGSGISLFNIKPIGDKMKSYANAVADIDTSKISNSITQANRLKTFINGLAGMDSSGVGNFKAAVEELGTVQIGNIVKAFNNASPALLNAGANLVTAVVNGMRSKQNYLTGFATYMLTGLNTQIRNSAALFGASGRDLMTRLSLGMTSRKAALKAAVSSLLQSTLTVTEDKWSQFYSAGSYLVDGFVLGISANTFRAEAQAVAMAKAAKKAAEEALGINSPSKVFYKIGDYTGQGFVNALAEYGSESYKASSEMANSARKGLTHAIANINAMLTDDMDSQPTIRPVLDLSSVKTGAAAIGDLIPSGASVGVMSNINSISSIMNERNQNGVNDDIVSAINKLRGDLGNVGNTSYNIQGITYDDGSNVAEAMKAIVRAANIERRA